MESVTINLCAKQNEHYHSEEMKVSTAEQSADLFYSPSNIAHLETVIAKINDGTATLTEHELILE